MGARLGSLGSFQIVWFVGARTGDLLVGSVSSGSSGCALVVAGFVLVWYVRVRPGDHWVGLGSSVSSGYALGVAGFVEVRPSARG